MYVKYMYTHGTDLDGDAKQAWSIVDVGENVDYRREHYNVARQRKPEFSKEEYNYFFDCDWPPLNSSDIWSVSVTPETLAKYTIADHEADGRPRDEDYFGAIAPIVVTWTDADGTLFRLTSDSPQIYLINDRGDTIQNLSKAW